MADCGRDGVIRVEGVSMLPTFPPDTRILVDFSHCTPRPGDVLLFRQAGSLVVHRFLAEVRSRRAGECLRTRGDGVSALDSPLFPKDVVGKVTAFRRSGTWWSLETGPARAWGRLVALHDHFWAVMVVAGSRVDRFFSRIGLPRWTGRLAASLDRWALRWADRLLFRLFHTRIVSPRSSEVDLQVDSSDAA